MSATAVPGDDAPGADITDDVAVRGGTLAAWTSAWRADAGAVSADEIIRAVTSDDAPHRVTGLFGSESDQPLSAAVIDWRRRDRPVTLLLPVPGDLRGLPPEPDFRAAAVEAGAAVVGGGLALVPERIEYYPSSAPPTITWQAFEVGEAPADHVAPAEAAYELAEAIRASAAVLARAGVGSWTGDGGERAARVRTSGDLLDLPPGYPGRAVSLISQALRMRMLVQLAEDPGTGAVDLAGQSLRAVELRALGAATRQALLAGYNALARN